MEDTPSQAKNEATPPTSPTTTPPSSTGNGPERRQPSPGNYVSLFFIIILGSAAATQFFGPFKGWADKYLSSNAVTPCMLKPKGLPLDIKERPVDASAKTAATDKTRANKGEEKKTDVADKQEAETVSLPDKTVEERKFDELFEKYLKKMKMPAIGKKYKFKLKAGGEAEGILKAFSDGKVEIEQQYGKMGYPINIVDRSAYPDLFPKRAAQILAQMELDRIILAKAETEKTKIEAKPETQVAKLDTPAPAPANAVMNDAQTITISDFDFKEPEKTERPQKGGGGEFKYDTTFAETPPELKTITQMFGKWLIFQQGITKLKMAEKIFTKQQEGHTVLYIEVTPLFAKQDYDFRFGTAEGMAKFWSFRCLDAKTVRNPNDAHIVFVDSKSNIIGGSNEKSGSEVWVKK